MDNNNKKKTLNSNYSGESLDEMYCSWKNSLNKYVEMLKRKKIWLISQEKHIAINIRSNKEFIDIYEYDNHLELYKIIVKTLKSFKNRCKRDKRRNVPDIQNE